MSFGPDDYALRIREALAGYASVTVDGRVIPGYYGEVAYEPKSPPNDREFRISEREYRSLSERAQSNDAVKVRLAQYAEQFARLTKQAAPYATVLRVKPDGKTVLLYQGKQVECTTPKDKVYKSGATVTVTGDTLQIMEVVTDDVQPGEVVTITRVADNGLCEVERAGTTRAVYCGMPVEEGDRAVVDSSGSVVMTNLGKARNDHAFAESTGVTWDDIGGLEDAKAQLKEAIEGPVKHSAAFTRYAKKRMGGVLLYGPPGTGKTLLGKAVATALAEMHGNAAAGAFFYVKGPELLNMYVGNTEAGVRKLFDDARRHKAKHGFPAVIFLDEADAILGKRGGFGFGLTTTVVPAFLAEMDGLEDSGAIVLLATNRPDTLDPAIVRDGRIDRRVRVTRPNRESALAIFMRNLAKCPAAEGTTTEALARAAVVALFDKSRALYDVERRSGKTQHITLADIVSGAMVAGIVDRATSLAMARDIATGSDIGLLEDDLRDAVARVFSEALDVNHDDEILEYVGQFTNDVLAIRRAGEHRAGTVVTLVKNAGGAVN